MRAFSFLLATILMCQISWGQEQPDRPKIGLVLSGGGARGLAHIGAIQALEEMGIRPDYVTGTSMGAIIGSFYSIGYTPDQIYQIASSRDWNVLLGNIVPLENIVVEEKGQYARFITELKGNDGKLNLPSGLIEGQELHLALSELTQSVHHIRDFHDFPIPFKCVAADIAAGEKVVLDSGDIVKAMRASMAIPSVFTPVEIDSKLLVDGGLVRNFPVEECLSMGADIIIGIFVSTDLDKKEDLKSAADILQQAAFIMSAKDTEQQKKLVDYYIEPDMHGLTSADFGATPEFTQFGYEAVQQKKDELLELMRSLDLPIKPISRPPLIAPPTFNISDIVVHGLNRIDKEFVLGRIDVEKNSYTMDELTDKVRTLYGTRYFEKITFNLETVDDSSTLVLEVTEVVPSSLGVAFYYNNEIHAGVTLNYTNRWDLLKKTRLSAEANIAQNPMLHLQVLKYLTDEQNWVTSLSYKSIKQNNFILGNADGSESVNSYTDSRIKAAIGQVPLRNTYYGVYGSRVGASFVQNINGDTNLRSFSTGSWNIGFEYRFNNQDRYILPRTGWDIDLNVYAVLNPGQHLKVYEDQEYWRTIIEAINDELEPYGVVEFKLRRNFTISDRFFGYGSGFIGFNTTDLVLPSDYFRLGGVAPILPKGIDFHGLRLNQGEAFGLSTIALGLNYSISSKLTLHGMGNYALGSFPTKYIIQNFPDGSLGISRDKNIEQVIGGSVSINYSTIMGPAVFGFTFSDYQLGNYVYLQFGHMIR